MIAIVQDGRIVRVAKNTARIALPDGSTVMGPVRALPHTSGDYTLMEVAYTGSAPGAYQTGSENAPVIDGERAVIESTVEWHDADTIRADKIAAVNAHAEAERLKYITAGSGQAMAYNAKAAEAKALKAALAADPQHTPDAADYPFLAASLDIEGETLDDVATVVLTASAAWSAVGAAIERARITHLNALEALTDPADLAAYDITTGRPS